MKYLFTALLTCCFFLASCDKEEENYMEEINVTNNFYVDFPNKDNLGIVSDSLYFIDSEESLVQFTSGIPSIYEKTKETDFDRNTIVITGSREDYNLFSYEIKMRFYAESKVCNLIFSYVLDDPPYLENPHFRVWVCVVPKMSFKPLKSYVLCNIGGQHRS